MRRARAQGDNMILPLCVCQHCIGRLRLCTRTVLAPFAFRHASAKLVVPVVCGITPVLTELYGMQTHDST